MNRYSRIALDAYRMYHPSLCNYHNSCKNNVQLISHFNSS